MIACLVLGHAIGALCADCAGAMCAPSSETPPAAVAAEQPGQITVTSSGRTLVAEGGPWAELTGVEDHRCAAEVQCVWAGYAVVRFRVGRDGEPPADLAVGGLQPQQKDARYGSYRFELLTLEPKNSMEKSPSLSSYRARMQVSRVP